MALDEEETNDSTRHNTDSQAYTPDSDVCPGDIVDAAPAASKQLSAVNNLTAASVLAAERDGELQALQATLAGHSVENITKVIESIIADKSVSRRLRREAVGEIVENQPHPAREFDRFRKWNQNLRDSVDFDSRFAFGLILLIVGIVFSVALGWFAQVIEGYALWQVIAVSATPLAVFGTMGAGITFVSYNDLRIAEHHHHDITLEEHHRQQEQEKIEQLRKKHKNHQEELRLIGMADEGVSPVSVSEVRDEFADAQARIASYELDIKKSLSLPAFNNVMVPEVNTMVKQLRKCARLVGSMTASNASDVSIAVDELWVDIQAAEHAAQQYVANKFSDEERKDLNLAKSLLAHAEDTGNTEEARLSFYTKLSSVVKRLNERRAGMVAVRTTELIQEKARPELTALRHDAKEKEDIERAKKAAGL